MRGRLGLFLAALCAAGLTIAATAAAQGPNPPALNGAHGVVPALQNANNEASGVSGFGRLYNHGGPTMTTNRTYAIYWIPSGFSVSPGYVTLINGFLGDVAADSGNTSNVYYSDTQYSGIQYSSAYGGYAVDNSAFPASGCSDSVSQTTVCLSDAQLQAEVSKVRAANGWANGPNALFFVFTPQNVGSCAGSDCAFSTYCAYHSWFGSGSSVTLYANQPYTDTVPSACDATAHPNQDAADPTINVVSHEHNEAITDEQGNAWYDLAGYENGDKCAWNFGAAIGTWNGAPYNQLINGNHYELQQEYSNAHKRCVLTGT